MWIIFSILSSICAALMAITIKIGLKDLSPILSLTIRTFIVFLISTIVVIYNKSYSEIKMIKLSSWSWLMITSIITFFTWYFYFLAMKNGIITKIMAIDKLSIVLVIIFSIVFLKEKLTFYSIIGIISIILGCIFLLI